VLVGLLVTPIHFGARHALPAICMLGLLSGRLIKQRPRWAIPLVFSLVIGSGLGMVRCWPHYLAYCNELAGGPSEGHRILIDTNLDMGQDLAELARWVERKKLPVIYLCYFGSGDPRAHGIPYRWVPDDRNAHLSPGYPVPARLARRFLAISVMNLYLHHDRGFSWLTRRKPVATMGHTILVFDITRDAEAAERLSTIYAAGGYREQADYELRRSQQLKNRRGR
jgi:hypothetical protein